jgi:hypothetical protein
VPKIGAVALEARIRDRSRHNKQIARDAAVGVAGRPWAGIRNVMPSSIPMGILTFSSSSRSDPAAAVAIGTGMVHKEATTVTYGAGRDLLHNNVLFLALRYVLPCSVAGLTLPRSLARFSARAVASLAGLRTANAHRFFTAGSDATKHRPEN